MDVKSLYGDVKEENLCEMAKWEQYDKAKPKVLFVLKEPSIRKNEQNYNFKEALENKEWNISKMWRLLACCSEGLQTIAQESCYEWKNSDECRELLKHSSYMNLKRFGAGITSNMGLIGLHTGLFWPLMMHEIKELKPDIIVFCNTFVFFKELIECLNKLPNYIKLFGYSSLGKIGGSCEEVIKGKKEKTCYWNHWNCDNISQKPINVIRMPHPAARGMKYEEYFKVLMKLGRKIVQNGIK